MDCRLCFVHDHRFLRYRGRVYSPGQFPSSVWQRYLDAFDSVCVVARQEHSRMESEALRLWNLSSVDNVDFRLIETASWLDSRSRARARAAVRAEVLRSDAVVVRLPSELGLIGADLAVRLGRPWAVEVAGCAWDALWNYGTAKAKTYAPVAYGRMRRVVRRAPFAVYVSRRFLQRRYPSYGQQCSASNVSIPQVAIQARDYASLRFEERIFTIGFMGALGHRYKGLHILLKAVGAAQDELKPLRLRVLGRGCEAEWTEEVRRRGLQDIVVLEGVLPAGEPVMRWLDGIDLLVQPSLQEGLPRTVIEAMSRGIAVLGSRAGGTPELLREDALHSPGDWRALAEQLRRVRWDAEWCADNARQNLEIARAFTDDVVGARRRAFWHSFAQYARSRRRFHRAALPVS